MDFFNRLLTPDAPPGSHLRSAEWSLRGPLSAWTAILVLLAIAAAVAWLYSRETGKLAWGRRVLLAGLRIAALALLLGLAMRPVLTAEFAGERARGVAVLLDNSQSLTQQDRRVTHRDRQRAAMALGKSPFDAPMDESASNELPENPPRADLVKGVLGNESLNLIGSLERFGPLRQYLGGQRVRSVTSSLAEAFTSDDQRTAIADNLAELLQKRDGDAPAAIVLITDGVDNASKLPFDEVARECIRLGVPLHIWGVGSSEAGVLALRDAVVPDTLFFDDTVSVPLRWRGQGFKQGSRAIVSIRLGGRVVASREVPIRDGELGKETLSFTPQKRAGGRDETAELVVSVRSKDDPTYVDEIKRPVQLLDRKVKVLVIEGQPRWEYKFLQPALMRDRRVAASFWLADGDPRLMQTDPFLSEFPPRDKLFGYDLVILGDVPPAALTAERTQQLQDYVREGGGLVVIAGRSHMPAKYDNSPLTELLPVEFLPIQFGQDAIARPASFHPEVTPAGERSEMLTLADSADENRRVWKDLPGFYWHYPATKLRPGATTLLGHPGLKLVDGPMPLMASQYYGKGQVLWVATDESWRWRFNDQEPLFARFWGQVVYRMGLPHLMGNARRVQLALERGEAVLGRPGYVYARLLDAEFKPLTDLKVPATLEREGVRETINQIQLDAVPGRAGEYRAFLNHDVPGKFDLKVKKPEAATFAYRVNLPPRHELEPSAMAEGPLRELAAATGGVFYHEEDLPSLAANIKPQKAAFVQRREILFWNPLALVLFVGLVTVEWIVRKFANLS